MEGLEIIAASDTEILEQCLKVRNDVFTVEKNVPKSIEVDEYDCLTEECDHFLIRFCDNNAGAFRCLHCCDEINGAVIKIQRFCIYASFRKTGLGRAVMDFVERYYRQKGVKKIILDAKFEVNGFYQKCGYHIVSDVFTEAGIKHVKMEKNIGEKV